MENHDIRLVALDLDRTTLDSAGRLSARTRQALEAAAESGVHVVIATGRAKTALPADVFTIRGVRYIATANGACVTDMADDSVIYSNCIGGDALDATVALLKKHDYMYEFFVGGRAYVERSVFDRVEGMNFTEGHKSYIKSTRTPVDGLMGFALRHRGSIENINLNFEHQSDKAMMREVISALEDVTVTASFDHNLEIGGATTSKADAVSVVCARLGVSQANVMACGDSLNDVAMLMAAGFPVAMGNAKDEVKAVAKHVTSSNDEDGVAKAVERFVLKK